MKSFLIFIIFLFNVSSSFAVDETRDLQLIKEEIKSLKVKNIRLQQQLYSKKVSNMKHPSASLEKAIKSGQEEVYNNKLKIKELTVEYNDSVKLQSQND